MKWKNGVRLIKNRKKWSEKQQKYKSVKKLYFSQSM